MYKQSVSFALLFGLSACATSDPIDVSSRPIGYEPPPEKNTIIDELKLEYQRCIKLSRKTNCAQAAYDVVRVVKGLESKKIPQGYVLILQGDVEVEQDKDKSQKRVEQ